MPLIIRTPATPDPARVPGTYPRALNVLDRRKTAVQRQLRRGGLAGYDHGTTAVLLALMSRAPADSVLLDVGAGIGLHSALVCMIMADRKPRCRAFEPTPETAAIARTLAYRNGLEFEVVEEAVSAAAGPVTLYVSETSESSNSLNSQLKRHVGELTVPATTIDAHCERTGEQPYLIRVDVASHEPEVLAGAQRTIAAARPWIVCKVVGKTDAGLMKQMLNHIEQVGYTFHALSPALPWPSTIAAEFATLRGFGGDCLFAPQPVTDDLVSDVRGWLGSIAACDEITNLLTRGGEPLPDGWNAPHEAPAPTVPAEAGGRRGAWRSLWRGDRGRTARPPVYEGGPEPASVSSVAVLCDGDEGVAAANRLGGHYPDATIHLLSQVTLDAGQVPPNVRVGLCPTLDGMYRYLVQAGNPQLLVDAGERTAEQRLELFQLLFLHLSDGGRYAVESASGTGDLTDFLDRMRALRAEPPGQPLGAEERREKEWANAIGAVTRHGERTFVGKRGRHLAKLPDGRTTAILTARFGDAWGRVLQQGQARSFASRAVVTTNRPELADKRFRDRMDVPAPVLREYREVTCWPGQLALLDGVVLPISFHHPWARRLKNRRTTDVTDHFCRTHHRPDPPARLPGAYYHLDSEFPGHFGHVTTEDIAKLWGWEQALRRHPDLRLLLSTDEPGGDAKPYQRQILHAYGVPDDRIVLIDQPVRVDVLVGASQRFQNPLYVDPAIEETWARIGAGLRVLGGERPSRLFISRPADMPRGCSNADQVEEFFAEHGFAVVYPEQLPLGEQVDLFASADVIAGFAGSGMFNAIYNDRPGVRIVIGSETYNACNEYLISAAKGDRLHYYWCAANVVSAAERAEVFHSGYTFDMERDGPDLRAVLAGL